MIILGIETSCDDTSVALIKDGVLLSMNTHSQLIHRKYGGVMPEMASREHVRFIHEIVELTLSDSNIEIKGISGIAVTFAPGLAGSLLVGLNFAKGFALKYDIRLIGIHHLEGHIASNYIGNVNWAAPFLCLLVSGGHTQLIKVNSLFDFEIIGTTLDDAVGEAFDKTAKILGLTYPGGPLIDKYSKNGNPLSIDFPVPYVNNNNLNFSYSGLKTSVLNYTKKNPDYDINDVCASFQRVAIDALMIKIKRAINTTHFKKITIAGGVSANSYLRDQLKELKKKNVEINLPEIKYCMDNGAMIAMAGYLRLKNNFQSDLNLEMKPVLPLNEISYEPISI